MSELILVLGLAIFAGLLSTRLMKVLNLPNVTGYLIVGLLIGPYLFNTSLISVELLESMKIITTVALGFVAFSIGSSFRLDHMKSIGKNVVIITFMQAFGAFILVTIALLLVGADFALALVLGAIATATAPAATLMIVRQYKAKGPVTDTLLPVVALDDAIGLMIFSIALSVAQVLVTDVALTLQVALVAPIVEILGSLVVGAMIGFILSYVSRFFKSRSNRLTLLIVSVFIGVALSMILHLSSLLMCMMIGAVYTNVFKEHSRPLDVLDRWTYPIYMMFFILSGAELNIALLPTVGLIGVVYILVRAAGKYFGAYFGSKLVHAEPNIVKYLGLTLLPQAGVAIGMAQIVLIELPEYGVQITTVVLCATVVYEIIGPLVSKIALAKAGEIDPEMLSRKKKDKEIDIV